MIRERSSRSSMSWVWILALRSMASRPCSTSSASSLPERSSRDQPTMALERGAQLVREGRQELVLHPAGGLGLGAGILALW